MPLTTTGDFKIHVNGETTVFFGGSEMGISIEGIDIRLKHNYDEITIDGYGKVPGEMNYMLTDAEVEADLVLFNPTNVTAAIREILDLNKNTLMGQLVVVGGFAKTLELRSRQTGTPNFGNTYIFNNAYLMESQEISLGTKRSSWKLKWRCLPGYNTPGDSSNPPTHTVGTPIPPIYTITTTNN